MEDTRIYMPEELVPVVAKLANKYNGIDSSSMTYERANQLMEAVIYCIREGRSECCDASDEQAEGLCVVEEGMSPEEAYTFGLKCVETKTKAALKLYHKIMESFDSYGNYYLAQTVKKGMPEFFKWYDIRFAPQNTLLTLDYAVLNEGAIQHLCGIDAIDAYLHGICAEQKFLSAMPRENVIKNLKAYHSSYTSLIDNLCPPILEKLFVQSKWKELQEKCPDADINQLEEEACAWLKNLIQEHYQGDKMIYDYLKFAMRDLMVRLRSSL